MGAKSCRCDADAYPRRNRTGESRCHSRPRRLAISRGYHADIGRTTRGCAAIAPMKTAHNAPTDLVAHQQKVPPRLSFHKFLKINVRFPYICLTSSLFNLGRLIVRRLRGDFVLALLSDVMA